jgi:hypothetical protein
MNLQEQISRMKSMMVLINETDYPLYLRRRFHLIDELVRENIPNIQIKNSWTNELYVKDFQEYFDFLSRMVIKQFVQQISRDFEDQEKIRNEYHDDIMDMILKTNGDLIKQSYLEKKNEN